MSIETTDYEQWIMNPFTQAFLNLFEDQAISLIREISHSGFPDVDSILEICGARGKLFMLEKLKNLFEDEKYCLDVVKNTYGE